MHRIPLLLAAFMAAPLTPAALASQQATPAGAIRDDSAASARRDTLPDTLRLPDLVVTATRVPLARGALPTPVTVLSGDSLRDAGIRTVAAALRTVPGATVVRAGSGGAQTSLFLRGGESDYVKVLVDGVPVNDPGGAFDFTDLSTDQVERIEVVRGPVSVLYGSDAVAGVIQVFTKRGRGPASITAGVTGARGARPALAGYPDGAYGEGEATASVAGSAGAVSYAAGGSGSWTDGLYPFNNARRLTTGTARLAWTPAAGTEVALTSLVSDSRSGFPTDGTGALVDHNARIDRNRTVTALQAGTRLARHLDARVHIGVAHRHQLALDPPDDPADTLSIFASELEWNVTRLSADARLDADLPGATLTAGASFDDARADTRYDSRSEWGPSAAAADYRRSSRGYYAQLLATPFDGVHFTAGGRLDRSATFGSFATYRLGATARLASGTQARAALGRGFREPAFDESFGSGFGDRGNPDLVPERSRSWEVGLEQEIGAAVRVAATWFDQHFDDLIQFTFTAPDPDAPNYFNVGAAAARGLELEASAVSGPLALRAGYTRLLTTVLDPGLASDAAFQAGRPLLRRPRSSGSFLVRYAIPRGEVTATVTALGPREDLDFAAGTPAPRVTLPACATLDLGLERRLDLSGAATTLRLGVENLLDERYQTVVGFPAPGRLVRVGMRVRVR